MKKLILLAVMAVFVMSSCNSNGDLSLDGKDDYTFKTTITTTCSPKIAGYPQTTTNVTTKKGITAAQAKEVADALTSSSTTYSGSYTITQKMTCVYVLTKDYVPSTGARVVT